ncbi:hypothetical protein EV1_020427 [Malus domestica]
MLRIRPKKQRAMKQGKLTVVVKELTTGHFHVKITIILSVSMLFFILFFGIFVNDHTKKFLSSDQIVPQLNTFTPPLTSAFLHTSLPVQLFFVFSLTAH